jgi:hypothetical protein
VNLAIFTLALPFGLGVEAFYAVVGLQLATVVYHLVRVVQFWDGVPTNPRKDGCNTEPVPMSVPVSSGAAGALES